MQNEGVAERTEPETLRDNISSQAYQQLDAGLKHKQPRVEVWNKANDLYHNKKEPAMVGRFNVPLPIVSGYVDTLHAKLDDSPYLEFQMMARADSRRTKKIGAAWAIDSSSSRANWKKKDRAARKIAIMTGRGNYKIFAENDPTYKHYLEVVDSYDLVTDPIGGSNLEDHRFVFQDNIFRSKDDLEGGKQYNKEQVKKLSLAMGNEGFAKNEVSFRNKLNKFFALGIDDNNLKDYDGVQLFRLTEGMTIWKGERWYILFEPTTKIWVRCEKMKDVFEARVTDWLKRMGVTRPPLLPWVSFATHEDPFVFWSKAPVEDIIPIAVSMKVIFNQALYNINKRNAGQRAYDPAIFKRPDLLEYRPDGLTPGNATDAGKNLSQGIYEFRTEDNTAITVNLMNFLDNFLGQKTGITASAQGAADKDAKVGVYYGDLQQVADRLGLYNKSYHEAWEQLGIRYIRDLWENFSEKILVRWIGGDGVQFDELREEDIDPELVAIVKGGNIEAEQNALKQKQKTDTLTKISANPRLAALINPQWELEQSLRDGGYEEEDIRQATDLMTFGSQEELSVAEQAIQDIKEGKEPEFYYGATTAFMQKLVNFATKKRNYITFAQYDTIMKFAYSHRQIATENMLRLAEFMQLKSIMARTPGTEMVEGPRGAVPNTPGGTASRSQNMSEMASPGIPTA